MAEDLFPKLAHVRPIRLEEATQALPDFDTVLPGGTLGHSWKRIIDKIRSHATLTEFEKIQVMNNIWALDETLVQSFSELFLKNLDAATLGRAAKYLNASIGPPAALKILLCGAVTQSFGVKHVSHGIARYERYLRNADEVTLIEDVLASETPLDEFVSSFSLDRELVLLTQGQARLLAAIAGNRLSYRLLDLDHALLLRWFDSIGDKVRPAEALLNACIGSYCMKDERWKSQLLEQSACLNKWIATIQKMDFERRKTFKEQPFIKALFVEYELLTNVIERLNRVEPDRGEFWKGYIKYCDYVQPRTFDRQRLEACAFAFKNYVIVEFAPSGNAAFFYERSVFESFIRKSTNWKQDGKTLPVPGTTRDNGTFWHVDRWQDKLHNFLANELRRTYRR